MFILVKENPAKVPELMPHPTLASAKKSFLAMAVDIGEQEPGTCLTIHEVQEMNISPLPGFCVTSNREDVDVYDSRLPNSIVSFDLFEPGFKKNLRSHLSAVVVD